MRSERGQAALEWVGMVLLVCVACGAAIAAGAGAIDGRPLGAELARALVCAVRGGCDDGDDALRDAYGERDAALVREYLPNLVYERRTRTLPVDFRDCRSHRCSDAPDEEGLDVHRTRRTDATVFTHLLRDTRSGAGGGETFIQYWLYYPDSTSTWMGSAGLWNQVVRPITGKDYPGWHEDDWESVQVRIDDRTGAARMRASSHHWYQGCKERHCRNTWTPWGGWSRVSYGSHAGHIPQPARDPGERTTTAAGVRLVPIEGLKKPERATEFEVTPPWDKRVYLDPRSDSTG
jgi:hypothetical protein